MKTETLDRIRKLTNTANELRKGLDEFTKMSDNPRKFDKLKLEFGSPRQGLAGTRIIDGVMLINYSGTYGDSGVSPFIRNREGAEWDRYFIYAINDLLPTIVQKMAYYAEAEASTLLTGARSELASLEAALTELEATRSSQGNAPAKGEPQDD